VRSRQYERTRPWTVVRRPRPLVVFTVLSLPRSCRGPSLAAAAHRIAMYATYGVTTAVPVTTVLGAPISSRGSMPMYATAGAPLVFPQVLV
jgi:hypothetical protein